MEYVRTGNQHLLFVVWI